MFFYEKGIQVYKVRIRELGLRNNCNLIIKYISGLKCRKDHESLILLNFIFSKFVQWLSEEYRSQPIKIAVFLFF